MKNIVLIGAGAIGSRHLQGLARVDFDAVIEVVDKSEESLKVAKERFEEVENSHNSMRISYLKDISDININIDLAIIATTTNIRLSILEELIKKKKVKNIILEKIAFGSNVEFEKAIEITQGINVWVNCPKRAYPFFQELKSLFKGKDISYIVQSGDNALASNAIHYIDDFAFLTDCYDMSFHTKFDDDITQSRHNKCIELTGVISSTVNNNTLHINFSKFNSTVIITILSKDFHVVINEISGTALVAKKESNWEFEKIDKKIVYYQSELTNILAEDILLNNRCNLVTLAESYKLHKPLLNSINEHLKEKGHSFDVCPIS